jgi:hypothetical protein
VSGPQPAAGPFSPPTPRRSGSAVRSVELPAPEPPQAPLEVEFDALYDRVLERLRRDLIVERERAGELNGPLF